MIENVYLAFLFSVLALSTSIEVTWAEMGFRLCSILMGIFSILFIILAIVFAGLNGLSELAVSLIVVFTFSYIIPCVLNCHRFKYLDMLKGIIYLIYMTPTYLNILPIYAISNTHDVTWSSNPHLKFDFTSDLKREKDLRYRNFRSRFLIVWVILNFLVGYGIVLVSEVEGVDIVTYIGIVVLGIIMFKVIL